MKIIIGKVIEEPIEIENIITEKKIIEMKVNVLNQKLEYDVATVVLPKIEMLNNSLLKKNKCIYAFVKDLKPNRYLLKKVKLWEVS